MSHTAILSRFTLIGCLVLGFGLSARADEPASEDLTTCKLPNAKMTLPGQGTPVARKEGGTVFAFSTHTFSPEPNFKEGEFTVEKFRAALKGDIFYGVAEGGFFMVTSGRIADLGEHYLYEFDGKELARPEIVKTKQDGHDIPGFVTEIQKLTGHCFLLETQNGKFVLLRIVWQDRRQGEMLIQWVYQPDGKLTFSIPKGELTKIQAPPITSLLTVPSTTVSGNVTDICTLLLVRTQMIQKFIVTVDKPAQTQPETVAKAEAILSLGQLRAKEAANALAREIDFRNPFVLSREISMARSYPAMNALIEVGIPGANAALDQINTDAKSEQPKEVEQRLWSEKVELRRNLLALVVLKVYGEKLAKIVLEDKIAESSDSKVKEAYQKALEAFPRIKNWLPEEEAATTMPVATMPTK